MLTRALDYVALDGSRFHIPARFITDFVSSPAFLWPVVPSVSGIEEAAAALHDFLVRNRYPLGLSLIQCHGYFREALELSGSDPWRVRWYYRTVYAVNWTIAGYGLGQLPAYLSARITKDPDSIQLEVLDLCPA